MGGSSLCFVLEEMLIFELGLLKDTGVGQAAEECSWQGHTAWVESKEVAWVSMACSGNVYVGWINSCEWGCWWERSLGQLGKTRSSICPWVGLPLPARLGLPLSELNNWIKYQLLNKMQLFSRCCLHPRWRCILATGTTFPRHLICEAVERKELQDAGIII